jgi:hypothetical protein
MVITLQNRGRADRVFIRNNGNRIANFFQLFKYDEKDQTVSIVEEGLDRVLDATQNSEGAAVKSSKKSGAASQKWKIEYVEKWDQASLDKQFKNKGTNKEFGFDINRPFYIINRMAVRRCLQVHGSNVKLNFCNQNRYQVWVFDQRSKTIEAKAQNNRSIQIDGNGNSRNVGVRPTNGRWFQMWRNKGDGFIVNEKGKVLDCQGQRDRENTNVIVMPKSGGLSQQFDIVYVDEYKGKIAKNGEMDTEMGLRNNVPFFIVSSLPDGRYMDSINNRNLMIKT